MAEILHFLGRFVGVQVRENPFLQALSEDPIQHDQIARTVLLRFLTADATWQPYTDTITWELQSDVVYAQFQDRAGNESPIYGSDGSIHWPDGYSVYMPLVLRDD